MIKLIFDNQVTVLDDANNNMLGENDKDKKNIDSKFSSSVKSIEKFRQETADKRVSMGGSDVNPLNNNNFDQNDVFNDFNESFKVLNLSNKNNLMNNINNVIMEEDSNFNLMNTLTNNNFRSVFDNFNIDVNDANEANDDGPMDYYEEMKPEYEKKEEQLNKTIQNELIK